MSDQEKDINDIFDDIALTEDKITAEGYDEGFARGVAAGNTEAYHLGYHRGAEFGAELGYYTAIVEAFKDCKEEKIVASLSILGESLEKFPNFNDTTCDFGHEMQRIRGQFRKICAFLKFKSNFTSPSDLSF